jgi:hypothetical protein
MGTGNQTENPILPEFIVPHFSVAEIAELWGLAPNTVRRIFEREPDVVAIGRAVSARGKQRRVTLRIPQPVAQRVWRRLQIQGRGR